MRPSLLSVMLLVLLAGCSSASSGGRAPRAVAPAAPPKDDGETAQGSQAGDSHEAALEQLRIAPFAPRGDKQNSILVPLPDAANWTRVRFLTVPGLVGFRYGKSHHAIVAGFVTHVDDNRAEGACSKSFETWAMPWVEAFEVELKHDAPTAFPWTVPAAKVPPGTSRPPKEIAILDIDSLSAKTATVLSRESYAAAWVTYPAWEKACLVVGVAIPAREDEARAKEVRDRFVKEAFPKVVVTAAVEPKERY
ncbi:MAG: hypothetical protein JWP97_4346 [Labilithrix sp.]|nr:hypothetical protein [Labilithrix sp.]